MFIKILRNRKSLILVLLITFSFIAKLAAQQTSAVIPYEMFSGKMIIKLMINGKAERVIFDTGAAKTSLSTEYCKLNNLKPIDSVLLRDVTSISANYKQTLIAKIATTDQKFQFDSLKAVIMPGISPVACFDVIGLIGSDILVNSILTIDSRAKTITIASADLPSKESLRYAHNLSNESILPIFSILINGQNLKILFDTGSASFMNLKQADFEGLKQAGAVKVIDEGFGAKNFGLAGKLDYAKDYQVYIPEIRLGPVKMIDIITETSNPPYTLLGMRTLENAKAVIDYKRRRFYFLPYQEGVLKPSFGKMNFAITVKNAKLTIIHVWKDLQGTIAEGDIVTHINGVETKTYEFCDVIKGLTEFRQAGPKMLTIKTQDGRTVNIEYKQIPIKI